MSKSSRSAAVLLSEDGVRIPGDLVDLAAFRWWLRSSRFPERGRIDWIGGDLDADLLDCLLDTGTEITIVNPAVTDSLGYVYTGNQ